jgi:hypothetical protein
MRSENSLPCSQKDSEGGRGLIEESILSFTRRDIRKHGNPQIGQPVTQPVFKVETPGIQDWNVKYPYDDGDKKRDGDLKN